MSRKLPALEVALESLIGNRLGAGVYRRWVAELGLAGNERVLEVGCGAGACARHLAAALPEGSLTCLDVDGRWLDIARRRLARFKRTEFAVGDIAQWQRAGEFDAVVVHFVLHDIPARERSAALANIAASLKPGGRLFLREPTGHAMAIEELLGLLTRARFRLKRPAAYDHLPLMGETIFGEWAHSA